MFLPPDFCRKVFVFSSSKFLSSAEIERKKPEQVAFFIDSLLKIGRLKVGNWLIPNIPNTVKNAVNKIVNSNVTGTNAGNAINGFPDNAIL